MHNLRAMPINGYVMDAAGNQIKGTKIIVKQLTADSQYRVVDTVSTDPTGRFTTVPLKPGTYDIFESGIKLNTVEHVFALGTITPFSSSRLTNLPTSNIALTETNPKYDINEYIFCIQIESSNIDLVNGGHHFPMYIVDDFTMDNLRGTVGVRYGFDKTTSATVTSCKFDVEYHYPTSSAETYKHIKWSGVRGVAYDGDKSGGKPGVQYPVCIPLTYWDISIDEDLPVHYESISGVVSSQSFTAIGMLLNKINSGSIGTGDIIKLSGSSGVLWCIISGTKMSGPSTSVKVQLYKKFNINMPSSFSFDTVRVYSGFDNNIESSEDSVSERFTVFHSGAK